MKNIQKYLIAHDKLNASLRNSLFNVSRVSALYYFLRLANFTDAMLRKFYSNTINLINVAKYGSSTPQMVDAVNS